MSEQTEQPTREAFFDAIYGDSSMSWQQRAHWLHVACRDYDARLEDSIERQLRWQEIAEREHDRGLEMAADLAAARARALDAEAARDAAERVVVAARDLDRAIGDGPGSRDEDVDRLRRALAALDATTAAVPGPSGEE